MVFITNYNQAMQLLKSIGKGKIEGAPKHNWIRHMRYALEKDHFKLNATQTKKFKHMLNIVAGKNGVNDYHKTLSKYKHRKAPPYPANKNCGKTMSGNDGKKYISVPNKNQVCTWQLQSSNRKTRKQ